MKFNYDAGCQGIEVYPCIKFRLPQWFSFSVTYTYMPPFYVSLTVVCYCFPRNEAFIGSQNFIYLPSFMFVVSELPTSNKLNAYMCSKGTSG